MAFLRKLEFCKKTRFYAIPMAFITVVLSHVYHVDKAQLKVKVNFQPVNTGRGAHLPPLEAN